MDSLRGKLLIASPTLLDPNFRRTVVLIASHDRDGALGVVLNRPSPMRVADAVGHLAPLCGGYDRLYSGGPVAPDAVLLIAEFDDHSLAALLIDGDLGLPSIDADPELLVDGVRRARCFAGHSGWAPGQLENELAQESWIIEQRSGDDAWTQAGPELWSTVLERKGGEYALLARMPIDPSVN